MDALDFDQACNNSLDIKKARSIFSSLLLAVMFGEAGNHQIRLHQALSSIDVRSHGSSTRSSPIAAHLQSSNNNCCIRHGKAYG